MDKETAAIIEKIRSIKEELGNQIVIPVHHYQNADITSIADFLGDSYKLAVECSKTDATYIIFCGVLFMAECADILRKNYQKVVIPAPNADCPMANMAHSNGVRDIFAKIAEKTGEDAIAPIVYMNSYSDIKSFCGVHGGAVCTSSNAHLIMRHYLDLGKKILFLPDRNLGTNTALKLGIPKERMISTKNIDRYNSEEIILWDGFCPVHERFTTGDVQFMRNTYPGIKIIVHPECPEAVAALADEVGSTEYILKMIAASPAGTQWGVGTETVFVKRLAQEFPDRKIIPLKTSECINMKKTTPEIVLRALENVKEYIKTEGKTPLNYHIQVFDEYKKGARASLEKMIEIVDGNR